MNSTEQALDFGLNEDVGDGGTPAPGLHLNFRNAPLHSVLAYLHDAAGLPIEVEPNVEIERTIDLWDDEPVSKEEAIRLLKQALDEEGYAVIDKRGMLSIILRQDAKKHYIPLPKLACSAFAG